MSESKEKMRGFREKCALVLAYEDWVSMRPPKWRFVRYLKWLRLRPSIELIKHSRVNDIPEELWYVVDHYLWRTDADD